MLTEIAEEIESSGVDGALIDEEPEDTTLRKAWDKISNHTESARKPEPKKPVSERRTITIEVPDTDEDSNNKQIKNLESLERNL